MQIEHSTDGNIEFIRLPRRIMMADAREVRKHFRGLMGRQRPLLALDMSDVEYIDSSGLAVLVNALRTSRRRGGDVCLYALRDTVRALHRSRQIRASPKPKMAMYPR